jgi:hypothetical protein
MRMSNHDPLDLAGIERTKAQKQTAERVSRETEEADIKWLMGSKRGRRIIWRHLERAGVFRLSFNTNAMQMAFAEGNRNDGLRTLALVHALCPELYPVMIKETNNDNRNTDDGN